VSRKKQHQLSFEPLEDRRVMAANLGTGQIPAGSGLDDVEFTVVNYDSTTTLGQLGILQQELYWARLAETLEGFNDIHNYGPLSIPTDPYLQNQWHLINTGQNVGNPDFQPIFGVPGEDINVAPAWELGYTGAGVVVAVIDSGVQKDHPDLAANIGALEFDALSLDGDASPRDQFPFDPVFPFLWDPGNAHGTAVAGLIGAVADNGIGGTGVAPGVQIVPIRLIDPGAPVQSQLNPFVTAFRYETDQIDITNNSWGSTLSRGIVGPTADELLALRDSVIFGRDGLGVIHVFSSGNSGGAPQPIGFQGVGPRDSASYDNRLNSRYTIAIGGVDHDGFYNNADGTVFSYPESGPNVLIASPTGSNAGAFLGEDDGLGSGIYTTDLTGENGFNLAPDPTTGQEYDRDFLLDTDYTSRFNGTSAAAPIATGAIALMLEANPNLSWRDVQEILVRSARQNAPLEVPANGFLQGLETQFDNIFSGFQNLWVQNQVPVFHDPDPYDPAIDPFILTQNPTLDPTIDLNHYLPTPITMTNGAGYTVAQGIGVYGEQVGYGHGVVDAGLAVRMAEQWHVTGQNLPRELSFTSFVTSGNLNLPAVEILNEDAGFQIIPGRPGGRPGFSAYWQEYFADMPDFTQNFPAPGTPLEFRVPDSNAMTVETVEVKVSINGDAVGALDNLRMLLVSPDGTHSELSHYFVEPLPPNTLMNEGPGSPPRGEPGSIDTQGGNLIVTFGTNRHWGERSDASYLLDPTTGEPVGGILLDQGWTLHLENYGSSALVINGIEMVWHGSPISANTQRVQGKVGIDENQDDLFNFSRITALPKFDLDGNPNIDRFGEIANEVDLTQEAFASNVTVKVRRLSDNVLVDQFIVGADGNFYFDLIPDDYVISVDDPLGRTAVEDTLTPSGFLQNYKTQWTITEDFFRLRNFDANLESPIDPATGAPFAWIDPFTLDVVEYGVYDVNFLLDPGTPAPDEVRFEGTVFADENGDGTFNGNDFLLPGINVFGDLNQNGIVDPGEVIAQTNGVGEYSLTVPLDFVTVMNVGVIKPTGWTNTAPASGLTTFFVEPGDAFNDVDFAIKPPVGGTPGDPSSSLPGLITGTVFNDANANATRDANEIGSPGVRVYLDVNNSEVFDGGDIEAITNANGAFIFTNVIPGQYLVRVDLVAPLQQTRPVLNLPFTVTVLGGGTVAGLQFGVKNPAVFDFGDLPAPYPTTLAQNGARHGTSAYFLGARIDNEFDGQPSFDAQGDDNSNDDEDGIIVDPLIAGGTGRLIASASRHLGYLQGWMDFNNNGSFNDPGERILTNKLLLPGVNEVLFDIPDQILGTTVYARFRYGEFGINSVTGAAQIGEVEDYALPYSPPVTTAIAGFAGDFGGNQQVDGFDFLAWQRGAGGTSMSHAQGDANFDGDVDADDFATWESEYGKGDRPPAVAAPPITGDFNNDGRTDGSDFLAWQSGLGTTAATRADGDSDSNAVVDGTDLIVWSALFGSGAGSGPTGTAVQANGFSAPAPTTTLIPAASAPVAAGPVASDPSSGTPYSVVLEASAASSTHRSDSTSVRQWAGAARRGEFRAPAAQDRLFERIEERREATDEIAFAAAGDYGRSPDRLFDDLAHQRRHERLERHAGDSSRGDEEGRDAWLEALAEFDQFD
jgi:subtilisin family serine protease